MPKLVKEEATFNIQISDEDAKDILMCLRKTANAGLLPPAMARVKALENFFTQITSR